MSWSNMVKAGRLLGKGMPWPFGAVSGGGDMFKSVYDPDGDGKIDHGDLANPPTLHEHANKETLDRFGESGGQPTYNNLIIYTQPDVIDGGTF